MKRIFLGCVLAAALIAACGKETPPASESREPAVESPTTQAQPDAARLAVLVDEFFERDLELNPLSATQIGDDRYDDRWTNFLSPEYRAESLAMHEEFLARLQQIDPAGLQRQDWLTYESFRIARERAIEAYQFPDHLQPVQQFYLIPSRFVQLGSGASYHPFDTVKNYDDFLGRIDDYLVINAQMITNMKQGVEEGIVQPRILIEKVLPQLDSQLIENPEESAFYLPITELPATFDEAERRRLDEAYRAAITATTRSLSSASGSTCRTGSSISTAIRWAPCPAPLPSGSRPRSGTSGAWT